MATVNVHEAKTHLSRLLAQVEAGEEVTIAQQREARGPACALQEARQAAVWRDEGEEGMGGVERSCLAAAAAAGIGLMGRRSVVAAAA